MNHQHQAVAAARAHVESRGSRILAEFAEFLSLPNVSADLEDVEDVASHIVTMLSARGVDVETIALPGAAPIVTGRIHVSDSAPTIGIYAHYDGQPVDPSAWDSDPFSPTFVGPDGPFDLAGGDTIDPDWRIYARSTSDDKAPVQALVAALDAFEEHGISPSVNVVLLFEGQEEAGSPDLRTYLEDNAARFSADMWLICDGPVHQTGQPQIIFGVRGIAQMEITVLGPSRGLHSGHYGNWIPNPTWELVQLLASMRSREGDVQIKGFYDDVVEPTDAEIAAIRAMPSYEQDLLDELGVRTPEGRGASLVERMYRPSLNLRGFAAGRTGADAANVLPEAASVSLDIRLPPHHDPEVQLDRVERHIAAQGFHIVRTTPDLETRRQHDRIAVVTRDPHYTGMRVPIDSAQAAAVLEAARVAAPDGDVVAVPTLGGSVPVVHFADVLGTPTIITPMANHDNNQHDANENIRVGNLWYGVSLMAALMALNYQSG
ncbi:MAG: M20/M25/M40 family metallo-hydrolase [Acidimicrobiia bacterium]